MMTFLAFKKVRDDEDQVKQKIPEGTTSVDFVTLYGVQSHFDTLLRYVLSVTFCGAVLKVMDQKSLVKLG